MGATEESQVYRDLMRLKPEHLTPNAWAVQAGVSRAVWADMRRHGNPSRRTLEKLLTAVSSSLAEFEALRLGHRRLTRGKARDGLAMHGLRHGALRGYLRFPFSEPPLPASGERLGAAST